MSVGYGFCETFLVGADELACMPAEYGVQQQAAGFTQEQWNLLTSKDLWTAAERDRIPSLLVTALSISLRVAGLPPSPVPGAYVAAVIAKLVAPCNRQVACHSAPESFDLMAAAGVTGTSQVVPTKREQLLGLVAVFSSGDFRSLAQFKIDTELEKLNMARQAAGKKNGK